MRKTLNINLGGMAFIIDENAYELLHNYLESLKRKFNNETERNEILTDIEARIAEMLHVKLAGRKEVVSQEDVQAIMATLGKPEDIAGEETAEANTNTSTVISGTPIKRKVFRDPDDVQVGGVISGMCHYFGIEDPTWARIAAVILIFLTSGTIILIYLLLLVVIPKATTAAEKLQMKGEPVNIDTIQKEVKDAATKAGESIHRVVKDQNFFERLWTIIVMVASFLIKAAAAVCIFIAFCCLIAVIGSFIGFYLLGTSSFKDATYLIVDNTYTINLFSFGFLLTCAIPIIAIIYASLRAILGQRSRVKWLMWGLLGAWWIGVIMLVVAGIQTGTNFKSQSTQKQQMWLTQPANGNLLVQLVDENGNKTGKNDDEDIDFNFDQDGIIINGTNLRDMPKIPVGEPTLQLMPSENDSFYIQEIITANGRTKKDADKNAEMVVYSFSQTDTLLNLGSHLYIAKKAKLRNQHMKIRIAIPEGKKIWFADNIDQWPAIVKGDRKYDDTEFANTGWTTENGVVKCISGENHLSAKEDEEDQEDVKVKITTSSDKDKKDKEDEQDY